MSTETLRFLVIDDDEVDRLAVRRGLRVGGFEASVQEAGSVEAALRALADGTFDCVFLDFQLPGGDGMRVLREVRAAGNRVPIIMLTGQQDEELAVELMKAGATDYIPKGKVSPARLEQSVRSAIRIARAERAAAAAQEALRQSEERFRILHETSPDGFAVLRALRGEDGRIVDFVFEYVNPAATRLAGGAGAMLERRLLETFPQVLADGLFDLYAAVVETAERREAEVHYCPDGHDLWLRITAAKLGDGFAVTFSDITRRRQAETERERALEARARFYAAMSHELRTPINAMLGYTDLLLAGTYGSLSESQTRAIERANRAAYHLLELVNDVLDLSKMEAGKLEVQLEPTAIPELIHDLFTTVEPLARERGSELQFSHDDCDEPILTDPRRVRQILLNLLSNAIKFGASRPVRVGCARGSDGGVVVEVADQGVGIPLEDADRIFEEFVQLDTTSERGTGLGLPISKRLAQLLGGALEVESTPGQGSIFRLRLPPTAPHSSTPTLAVDQ